MVCGDTVNVDGAVVAERPVFAQPVAPPAYPVVVVVRPVRGTPPPFVTSTVWGVAFGPPRTAAKESAVADSLIPGASAPMVKVTDRLNGEFAALSDAMSTLAVYVPWVSEPVAALRVSVAGAVVFDSAADNQPLPELYEIDVESP